MTRVRDQRLQARPRYVIEAVHLPQVQIGLGEVGQGKVTHTSANAIVVNGQDLKAVVVAAEDGREGVLSVDPDPARGACELVRNDSVATDLAGAATLEADPLAVVVEHFVKDRAVALDTRLRVEGENLGGH